MQELYLLSPILLKKINKKLETQCFKRLRFKQVDVKIYKKIEKQKPIDYKNIVVTLTNKEEKALEKIKDAGLSTALKDFLVRCHTIKAINKEQKITNSASKSITFNRLKNREF